MSATGTVDVNWRAVTIALTLSVLALHNGASVAGENPLKAGAKALLFQAVYDMQLTSFSGSTISMKHHFSSSKAARLGLSVSTAAGTEELEDDYGEGQIVRDYKRGSGSIGLTSEYLWYIDPGSQLTLFWGIGPSVRYSWNDIENRGEITGQGEIESNSKTKSLGAVASMGIEWFPHQRIGILAQYSTSYTYNWYSYDRKYLTYENTIQRQHRKTESSNLNGDQVKLGLAAYW